jgi:adenylate cyclase
VPPGRRLTVVMFTDIVGYTPLAQANEAAALRLVKDQEDLIRPLLTEYHGREVKSTGDGLLVEFQSAREASHCAFEIQQRLRERNRRPGATPLIIRIGIHLGDVEDRGSDILGDAVNIASRVEQAAEPGGVCMSGQVFDQIRHKVPFRLEKMPSRDLKGIREPIEVYRIGLAEEGEETSTKSGTYSRLAVLPLVNISPDPKDEYFAEGLTEELISVLSQIQGLRVISRTSVNHYRSTSKPVGEIGRELHVGSVLEGSVRKAGENLRITIQLIDAESDVHRWAKVFDRKLDNVFAIQAEVATETARALSLELLKPEQEAIHRGPTENLAAYDFFLHGVAAFRRLTPEGSDEAIRCFEGAIQLDPNFGLACAYLANTLLAALGDFRPGSEVLPRTRELVQQALRLEPGSSEAHTASGNLAMQGDQDWVRAEAEFERAIELNPSSSTALSWSGVLLATLQRLDEAKERFRAAIEIDPLWDALTRWFIRIHYELGEFQQARAIAERAIEDFPGDQWPHTFLGLIYLRTGQSEMAEREARFLTGTRGVMGNDAAYLLCHTGRTEEARSILAEWHKRAETSYVSLPRLARLHAALGEGDAAIELLERDLNGGSRTLWFVYRMEEFDTIRSDPRFVRMLTALHLPTSRPKPRE